MGTIAAILKLLLTLVASYALILGLVYLLQARMLYLPNVGGRTLAMTPAEAGMDFEDVRITTADRVTLHGWFVNGPSARVLLFFHGNAGNISFRLESIRQFLSLGLSVMIIDYRGYGQSEGKTTEAGTYRDAEAAWLYLTQERGVGPQDIVVFGRSVGASIAARLASGHDPAGLILESSFTSVPDIAAELYWWLPARWLSRLSHATRDYVRDVRCPVLVVHSRDDEIIPFHHGEAVFAAAPEPKSLLVLRGTHNDAFIRDERVYLEGLRAFLARLWPQQFASNDRTSLVARREEI